MIKRSVPPNLWNQEKENCNGKDPQSSELNLYIDAMRSKILQIHRHLEVDGIPITARAVCDAFMAGKPSPKTK